MKRLVSKIETGHGSLSHPDTRVWVRFRGAVLTSFLFFLLTLYFIYTPVYIWVNLWIREDCENAIHDRMDVLEEESIYCYLLFVMWVFQCGFFYTCGFFSVSSFIFDSKGSLNSSFATTTSSVKWCYEHLQMNLVSHEIKSVGLIHRIIYCYGPRRLRCVVPAWLLNKVQYYHTNEFDLLRLIVVKILEFNKTPYISVLQMIKRRNCAHKNDRLFERSSFTRGFDNIIMPSKIYCLF